MPITLPSKTIEPWLRKAVEDAFPGAPYAVMESWLIDLANELGYPGPHWEPEIGPMALWKRVRWEHRLVHSAELSTESLDILGRMAVEYRSGPTAKVVTRDGRNRIQSIETFLKETGTLPYPPTLSTFLGSRRNLDGFMLVDGSHRWLAWANTHGTNPVECWVANVPT